VSSPGIDRPLVRLADFARWAGHEIKLETLDLVNGRRRFRGMLEGVRDQAVVVRLPDSPAGAEPVVVIPADAIAEAKLVLTDALLAGARQRQTAAGPLDDPAIEIVEDTGPAEDTEDTEDGPDRAEA